MVLLTTSNQDEAVTKANSTWLSNECHSAAIIPTLVMKKVLAFDNMGSKVHEVTLAANSLQRNKQPVCIRIQLTVFSVFQKSRMTWACKSCVFVLPVCSAKTNNTFVLWVKLSVLLFLRGWGVGRGAVLILV